MERKYIVAPIIELHDIFVTHLNIYLKYVKLHTESYDAPADTLTHMITMLNDADVLSSRLLGLVSIPEYGKSVRFWYNQCSYKYEYTTGAIDLILCTVIIDQSLS